MPVPHSRHQKASVRRRLGSLRASHQARSKRSTRSSPFCHPAGWIAFEREHKRPAMQENCLLPRLRRALPAVDRHDQVVLPQPASLVSHHSTAIPSARHIQQPSLPNDLHPIPNHNPITIPSTDPTSFHAPSWTPHPRHLRNGARPYSARIDTGAVRRGISPGRCGAAQLASISLESPVPL